MISLCKKSELSPKFTEITKEQEERIRLQAIRMPLNITLVKTEEEKKDKKEMIALGIVILFFLIGYFSKIF
jgi:hypothetical protein